MSDATFTRWINFIYVMSCMIAVGYLFWMFLGWLAMVERACADLRRIRELMDTDEEKEEEEEKR